jgi:hypothetical protein
MRRCFATTIARMNLGSVRTDAERFDNAVRQIVGKRLTYKELNRQNSRAIPLKEAPDAGCTMSNQKNGGNVTIG